MERTIDELERSCVRLLARRAESADLFVGEPADVIGPLGLTRGEYRRVMGRLERAGYITDPAPSPAADYRHFVVTPKLEAEGRRAGPDLRARLSAAFDRFPSLAWGTVGVVSGGVGLTTYEIVWRLTQWAEG